MAHHYQDAYTDANLRYLYNGPKVRQGRPKIYDGKVDCKNIDKRRIRQVGEDERVIYYSGVVYSMALKRPVRIAYVLPATLSNRIFDPGCQTALRVGTVPGQK